jgi:alpha-D-xyloside xylohydrolase
MKTHLSVIAVAAALAAGSLRAQPAAAPEQVCPGVWRITIGIPEHITPVSTRHYLPRTNALAALPAVADCPLAVSGSVSGRGCLVNLPLAPDEMIYGLGLQFRSFEQRGLKKTLRVNADPVTDAGDSHAPVPFYVTTRGYGVLVDTARYATFYCGSTHLKPQGTPAGAAADETRVEVPEARGVDVYVFAGPSLREAVERYNLFSGGGALPPRWGLGFWYRCDAGFDQTNVVAMATALRAEHIPCDVLGLEPGWQSQSYSCSFVWSKKFPEPRRMVSELQQQHYHVNLWEHAFTHPSSPLYPPLQGHSGDFQVWGGLVPDFLDAEARRIFADYHDRELVALGVSGFKLDECDNSDFTGSWSFPEISRFPSGADGEQMHSLFGLHYQNTIQQAFEGRQQRTYGLVRSSQALAAPSPYALYSDLYNHAQFIHAISQAGFCGLLWTPEVREASTPEELIRRLQSVVFSPLAMVNAWYLKNPPWKQVDRAANNAGQFAADADQVEAQCRAIIELRMQLIPYLHAAFVRYHQEGLPPLRALVMDYPNDPGSSKVDDEYLMGDSLLVAPVAVTDTAPATKSPAQRKVYLPPGEWQDFWTGEHQQGQREITVSVPLNRVPVYVKSGSILPLAQPTLSTEDPDSWKLTAEVFGDGSRPTTIFEDDGALEPQLTKVQLLWDAAAKAGRVERSGSAQTNAYSVTEWKSMR